MQLRTSPVEPEAEAVATTVVEPEVLELMELVEAELEDRLLSLAMPDVIRLLRTERTQDLLFIYPLSYFRMEL